MSNEEKESISQHTDFKNDENTSDNTVDENTVEHVESTDTAAETDAVEADAVSGTSELPEHDSSVVETAQEGFDADHASEGTRMQSDGLAGDEGREVPDPDAPPSEAISKDYFQDDEEYLEVANDKALFESTDIGIFQQEENTVSWEVLNFRKDSGKPRGRISLNNEPPILRINSSDDQYAEFLLTQQFAKRLSEELDSVHKAYFGIDTAQRSKGLQDKFKDIHEWILDHKVLSIVGFVLLVFVLVATVL